MHIFLLLTLLSHTLSLAGSNLSDCLFEDMSRQYEELPQLLAVLHPRMSAWVCRLTLTSPRTPR